PRRPRSSSIPYTTLFRSACVAVATTVVKLLAIRRRRYIPPRVLATLQTEEPGRSTGGDAASGLGSSIRTDADLPLGSPRAAGRRSEEHTSELQSRVDLGC